MCDYYYYHVTIFKVWELCSSIFGENSTKDAATLVHATPSNIQVGILIRFQGFFITDRKRLFICFLILTHHQLFAIDWQLFVSQVQVWHAG